MGIPSYFSHIVREHRDTIKELDNGMAIDNLYLDSNSIIYESVHELPYDGSSNYEDRLIKLVCNKIISHVRTTQPRCRLMIAFDGVAPVAKLDQQRNRRYKSWVQTQVLSTCSSKPITPSWNTCAITPGTAFMTKLGKGVRRLCRDQAFKSLEKIIVSPPDEPGEGEHKIYEAIRQEPDYHKTSVTVIYGLDADLIMLTLNHLHIAPQMYLYRETPHFIKSIDRTLEPHRNYVIDIPYFAKCLQDRLRRTLKAPIDGNVVRDYVFMCFLLGNDFLPHFPSLNIRTTGIDSILSVYSACSKVKGFHLVYPDSSQINWRNLRQLIIILAEAEYDNICEEHISREKKSRTPFRPRPNENPEESRFTNIPLQERAVEVFIDPEEDGWEWRYYRALFDTEINDERRKEICTNYLEGLEWTLAYYTTGCKSWKWNYRYHYPPLLSDLAKYVPYFDTTFVDNDGQGPVSPLVQLSYVLPRANLDLLPTKLFRRLLSERRHWYEGEVQFMWAYCRYFWESHAVLPHIDLGDLVTLVNSV